MSQAEASPGPSVDGNTSSQPVTVEATIDPGRPGIPFKLVARTTIKRSDFTPEQIDRFRSNIRKTDTCWLWTGPKDRYGYGSFYANGQGYLAHRVAVAIHNGRAESGITLSHTCDNPVCVRVSHLKSSTPAGNMQDMAKKGRARNGQENDRTFEGWGDNRPWNANPEYYATREMSDVKRACRELVAAAAAKIATSTPDACVWDLFAGPETSGTGDIYQQAGLNVIANQGPEGNGSKALDLLNQPTLPPNIIAVDLDPYGNPWQELDCLIKLIGITSGRSLLVAATDGGVQTATIGGGIPHSPESLFTLLEDRIGRFVKSVNRISFLPNSADLYREIIIEWIKSCCYRSKISLEILFNDGENLRGQQVDYYAFRLTNTKSKLDEPDDMLTERIVTTDGRFCVVSSDGSKNLGCFDTRAEAEARLAQVEHFKHLAATTPSTQPTEAANRQTIYIDFDGTINSYTSGWTGTRLPDPPTPGAKKALEDLSRDYRIVIYTARVFQDNSVDQKQVTAVEKWMSDYNIPYDDIWTGLGKPSNADLFIDDRGLRFSGDWGKTAASARRILSARSSESADDLHPDSPPAPDPIPMPPAAEVLSFGDNFLETEISTPGRFWFVQTDSGEFEVRSATSIP